MKKNIKIIGITLCATLSITLLSSFKPYAYDGKDLAIQNVNHKPAKLKITNPADVPSYKLNDYVFDEENGFLYKAVNQDAKKDFEFDFVGVLKDVDFVGEADGQHIPYKATRADGNQLLAGSNSDIKVTSIGKTGTVGTFVLNKDKAPELDKTDPTYLTVENINYVLNKGVKEIHSKAFDGVGIVASDSKNRIEIPADVTHIYEYAFGGDITYKEEERNTTNVVYVDLTKATNVNINDKAFSSVQGRDRKYSVKVEDIARVQKLRQEFARRQNVNFVTENMPEINDVFEIDGLKFKVQNLVKETGTVSFIGKSGDAPVAKLSELAFGQGKLTGKLDNTLFTFYITSIGKVGQGFGVDDFARIANNLENLDTIEENAFDGATLPERVSFPAYIIKENAFKNVKGATTVVLANAKPETTASNLFGESGTDVKFLKTRNETAFKLAENITNKSVTVLPMDNISATIKAPFNLKGVVGKQFFGEFSVILENNAFKQFNVGQNIANLFTNLPGGISATVKSVNEKELVVQLGGVSNQAGSYKIFMTIPKENLKFRLDTDVNFKESNILIEKATSTGGASGGSSGGGASGGSGGGASSGSGGGASSGGSSGGGGGGGASTPTQKPVQPTQKPVQNTQKPAQKPVQQNAKPVQNVTQNGQKPTTQVNNTEQNNASNKANINNEESAKNFDMQTQPLQQNGEQDNLPKESFRQSINLAKDIKPADKFVDIKQDHWASNSIKSLSSKGIIKGLPTGEFNANGTSKRADFIIMVVRLLGMEGEKSTETFVDVPKNAYYANAVGIAKQNGIAGGNAKGEFKPNENINRQDIMVILARILNNLDIKTNKDTSVLAKYKDSNGISAYANEAVATLINEGVITGDKGMLNPKKPVTRAELAVLLERFYNLINK